LEEAAHVLPYNSYGSVRVQIGDRHLGVVYFDSRVKDAFGDAKDMEGKVKQIVEESKLALQLLEMSHELDERPRIKLYPKK
jgi:hypothetical protein